MSVLAWGATGFGITVIAISVIAFWRLHHLPSALHPWLYRLATIGAYVGAAACALTVAGTWAVHVVTWVATAAHSPGGLVSGPVHVAVIIGGVILFADLLISMTKLPGVNGMFPALALPFAAVLTAPGGQGALYALLNLFPVVQWCADIAKWIG